MHCRKPKHFLISILVTKVHFFWILVAAEKDFVGANLVSVLHKLLSDERSAPEIKYNSMILICSVMGSGETSLVNYSVKVSGLHWSLL